MDPQVRIKRSAIANIAEGVGATAVSLVLYPLYTSSFRILTTTLLGFFKWLSYLTIVAMFLGIFAIAVGIKQILATERLRSKDSSRQSLLHVIADVLLNVRYSRALMICVVAYGFFYAAVSSIIVYRPAQNFAIDYLAVIPSVVPTVCCGDPGFIPIFTVYLTEHLGLLIIPANILLLVLVSSLVGVNAALALYGFDNRPKDAGAGWFGGFGAITGLFTACPTCAGLFLGNLIQGVGTAAVATVLAAYQPLFVAATLPLLLTSIYFMTRRLRGTFYSSCSIK